MEPALTTINRHQIAISTALLSLFVIGGFLFTFLLPPFQAPDENVHWTAGYQRVERLITLGKANPRYCLFANTLPQQFEVGRLAFKPGEKVRSGVFAEVRRIKRFCAPVTLSYGFVGSYPGIVAARAIVFRENSRPERTLEVFYLSRLLHGLGIALLLWRLISLMKKSGQPLPGILTAISIAVAPLMLQQSFAISSDCVVLALSISLITVIFLWNHTGWGDWLVLAGLGIAVGLTKPPALPVMVVGIGIGWWIARREGVGGSGWKIKAALAALLLAIVSGAWMTMQDHSPPAHQANGRDLGVGKQLAYMARAPLESLLTVNHGFLSRMTIKAHSGPLGWLDAPISKWTKRFWCLLLMFAVLLDLLAALAVRGTRAMPMAMLGLGLYLSGFALSLALYLTWTSVGGTVVEGLQGRYFLPIALLMPFALFGVVSSLVGGRLQRLFIWRTPPQIFCGLFGTVGLAFMIEVALDLLKRYW